MNGRILNDTEPRTLDPDALVAAHARAPAKAELSPKLKALGDGMIAAVKGYVARTLDSRVGELQARLDKAAHTIESLERRLSRNSDHLNRIESRLKTLEHK